MTLFLFQPLLAAIFCYHCNHESQINTKQVGLFKKNPIERSAATTAAADDADVS